MRQLNALDAGQRLWDVDNVEAHVHTTLDAALGDKSAWLNIVQYRRAFAFMWELCWELSGLEPDGVTLRWAYEVRGFYAPRGRFDNFEPIKLPQLQRIESAELSLAELREQRDLVLTSIDRVRPSSAYDPSKGLSFCTYSRRTMTLRLADWYRGDEDFGDSRYNGSRVDREISLEALADSRRQHDGADDASFLDRRSPGARLDFVDDLNRHAYQESLEEVLMSETASG